MTLSRAEILERARAARTLTKHHRWAAEMNAAGWTVQGPNRAPRRTAPIEQKDLDRVLAEYPDLNVSGMGINEMCDTPDEKPDLHDVRIAALWIAQRPRCAARDSRHPQAATSYGWKHVMEEETGIYVDNGTFIAAALIEGVDMRSDGTINPLLGLL